MGRGKQVHHLRCRDGVLDLFDGVLKADFVKERCKAGIALLDVLDEPTAVGGEGLVRVGVQRSRRAGWLHIEVVDSGPGIRPEDRDKMFVPYFSTKKKGTGLGLTIAHKIVTDHGGTIRVEENDPHGARFIIELPG